MGQQLSLFTRFGGVRPMAAALGESPSNVQGWKNRRAIPTKKQPKVLEIGNRLGLCVTAEDVTFPFPEDRAAQ